MLKSVVGVLLRENTVAPKVLEVGNKIRYCGLKRWEPDVGCGTQNIIHFSILRGSNAHGERELPQIRWSRLTAFRGVWGRQRAMEILRGWMTHVATFLAWVDWMTWQYKSTEKLRGIYETVEENSASLLSKSLSLQNLEIRERERKDRLQIYSSNHRAVPIIYRLYGGRCPLPEVWSNFRVWSCTSP